MYFREQGVTIEKEEPKRQKENDTGSLCKTGHAHYAGSLELLLAYQQACEEVKGLRT